MNEFQKAIDLTDSLVDRARGAALGVVPLSNERGDYGLLDDLADRIRELEARDTVLLAQAKSAKALRDMAMSAFATNIGPTVRATVQAWLEEKGHTDSHPREIWANVEISGDGKPLAGEWNHIDVNAEGDDAFIRKDVVDLIIQALSGRGWLLTQGVAGETSDVEKTLLMHYEAMKAERDAALRREARLKDSTQELRDLRREYAGLMSQYIALKNAGAIEEMFAGIPKPDTEPDRAADADYQDKSG